MGSNTPLFHADPPEAERPRAPAVAWRPTSVAAAQSVEPHLARLEQMVVDAITASANELTCDDVEVTTGLAHQTASARTNGLMPRHVIVAAGDKRPTRSGRNALVWRVA